MKQATPYFKQLEIGPMANFIYLIGDPGTREAAVVDPAWDVDTILKQAEADGYEIKHILVTHGHPDHINGVEDLINRTNAKLYMHKDETPWIKGWSSTSIPKESGDSLAIGETKITFLHTPGHTPGSQCFLVNDSIVAGDTLFIDSCGRTDLPGGDPKVMYETLTGRLMKLKDETVLFPGHHYSHVKSATMGEQKRTNPVLQMHSLDQFLQMMGPGLGL